MPKLTIEDNEVSALVTEQLYHVMLNEKDYKTLIAMIRASQENQWDS